MVLILFVFGYSLARSNKRPMFDSINNSKRLEFSHATMATYTRHSKQPKGILINHNLK